MKEEKKVLIGIDFELLWKKYFNLLSEVEQEHFDAWLSQDPRNLTYYEDFKDSIQHDKAPDWEIDQEKSWESFQSQTRRSISNIRWTAFAASVAVFIVASLFLFNAIQDPIATKGSKIIEAGSSKAVLITSNGEIPIGEGTEDKLSFAEVSEGELTYHHGGTQGSIESHTLVIPRGGEYKLVLPDRTTVWLNAESELTYPIQFDKNERLVELKGEAYFDVTHDSSKPFRVKSNDQIITVLGTEFNVSTHLESQIITTLVDGSVIIETEENNSTQMKPGEQVVFHLLTGEIAKSEVDVSYFVGWKDGSYLFKNEPLESILNTLSRWYDMDFQFSKESNRHLRFTGRVKKYENLGEFLKLLEKTNEVTFKIQEEFVVVE